MDWSVSTLSKGQLIHSLCIPSALSTSPCQPINLLYQLPAFNISPLMLHASQWLRLISCFYSWASWKSSPYSLALLPHDTSLLNLSQPGLPSTHSAEMALVRVTEELPVSKLSVALFFLNFQHYLAEWTILSLKHLVHMACDRPHSLNLLSLCRIPKCWCLPELWPRSLSLLFLNTHLKWPHPVPWHLLYKQMTKKTFLTWTSSLKSRLFYPATYLVALLLCFIGKSNLTSPKKNSWPSSTYLNKYRGILLSSIDHEQHPHFRLGCPGNV